jgi:hypothetical protein
MMRTELRAKLVRKPTRSNSTERRELTGEEVRESLAARARKMLNGEVVASSSWSLQSL